MKSWNFTRQLIRDERGGTAIEYGLIASLVVIAIIGVLQSVADENTEMWNRVEENVKASTD